MILSAQKKIFTLIFILIPIFLFSQNKKAFTVRTDIPPIIDGYLNDSVWNRAIPITDFYQHEPNPLYLPSEKTEVKILYDKNYLYVAFMCYDNESEKIIARELKLDGKWSGDDNVAIIFDTFNDDRNAYWFGTNALGMRDDAILSTGSGFNEEWHGIWDVRSAVVDSGWSCEMIFPFSTFKFSDDDKQIWGINFQRGIKRKGEVVQWTAYEKEHNFFMMSAAGDLIGMENISRGNPIYLKPFFTAGVQTTEAVKEKYVHKPGLDIKYGITEALSLDLTFNTDFAQVESDRARINLTRFPLFFPEKRDFFIEGSSIFNFSIGGSNLFYSRRIGISNGEEIPIIAGTKLVGRLNKMEVGFIDIQTSAKGDEPTTNYGIARLKYDVFDQSYAGVFLSNKISKEGYNRVFAGDFVYSTNKFLGDKNLSIGTGLMKTDETNGSQNSWAGKFYIDYPNDFINQFFTYRFIQENFNPEIGFISRTGIQTWIYNLRISPRINFYQINRLNFIPIESNIDIDKNNELLAGYFTVQPFGFSTIRGDRVSIEIHREFDKVENDFNVFGNSIIKKGRYWFNRYEASVTTTNSRTFYGEADFVFGDYYTGTRGNYFASLTWVVNKNLTFISDYNHNNISLPESKFKTNEFGARVGYTFSTMINSSLFAQWNNELELLNFNYRFNWQPNIGSNFYLVVNQLVSTEGKIKTKDFAVLAKLVWLFVI